jgi:hypothetical protein
MKTYHTVIPRPVYHSAPVTESIIRRVKSWLRNSPHPWAKACSLDVAKIRPGLPLAIYTHEQAPDPAHHPQLLIVERIKPRVPVTMPEWAKTP